MLDDSDTDDDSGEDDYSDYDEQKINFTDIAARPSSVRTDVHPKKLLEQPTPLLRAGNKFISCNPLPRAIIENDWEAFVRTLDLYEFAGETIQAHSGAYHHAVLLDRPEMLDELIRRTGIGIPIPAKASSTESKVSEDRIYLGLKVGGKRRLGHATQKQVQRKVLSYNYDLLRNAIDYGATKVIDYLAGLRPVTAFTHYAETHDDETAQYLRSIDNLSAVLPDLLGWQINELNESPLLCAVIDNKPGVLKQLIALKPSLMEEALHLRCG